MATQTSTKAVLIETYPEDWQPSANIGNVDPNLYEVTWSDDYTLFTTRKLFWHDESSYAKYQSGDMDHEQVTESAIAIVEYVENKDLYSDLLF